MYSHQHQYVHDRLHARRVEAERARLARSLRTPRPLATVRRTSAGTLLIELRLRRAVQ